MAPPFPLTDALRTVLANGPESVRRAALASLAALRLPESVAGLKLIEEWEARTPLADEARAARAGVESHLAVRGGRAPADATAAAFQEPASPYRVLGELGAGPAARVYLAVQVNLRRLVALKVALPQVAAERGARLEFQLAVQAIARLSHPNLVAVYDAGAYRGHLWLAEELIDGHNLNQLVAFQGPLPWERAVAVVADLARALTAAHEVGIVHHAIRPASVFVDRRGAGRLGDFALAGFGGETAYDMSGAACYRAPEQARGEADARADVYALGVALHHLLAGEPPFSAESATDVAAQQKAAPAPPPHAGVHAPEPVRALLATLLERDPARRPADAAALQRALEEAARASAPAPSAQQVAPPARPEPEAGETPADARTVLVVDDSQLVLRVLKRILAGSGYRVLTAETPQDALAVARENRIDLLLTDMVFPQGATGMDLVALMKKEAPQIPVVAMSGQIGKEQRDQLMGHGVATFLAKPLAADEVLGAVRRACVGAGRSLLLVDDDRLIRLVLKRLFESSAFRVRTASSIAEAQAAIAEAAPDVIISDLKIRHESGLALLRHVRESGLETPFIMLSASPDPESVIAAYRLRVFDFVVKSEDTAQLLTAVAGAVTGR